MAEKYVNADPNILQNYEIVVIKKDSECKTDLVLKQFMYFSVNESHPVVGILGENHTLSHIIYSSNMFSHFLTKFSGNQSCSIFYQKTFLVFWSWSKFGLCLFGCLLNSLFKMFNFV